MFWDRFYSLCLEAGTKPNPVCAELGLSSATATHWKNGKQPTAEILSKIADYFDVSVDYLLGKTDKKNIPADDDLDEDDTSEEVIILSRTAKKMSPEKQKKLLDMAKLMFKEDFED